MNEQRRANYEILERPDKVNRNRRDIDYILESANRLPRIAVEVSSVWRSGDAGMEDAYFAKWFARLRASVQTRVRGRFDVTMPVRVPDKLAPESFGESLIAVIEREAAPLAAAAEKGKNIMVEVQGVRVHLYKASPEGSDIDYARYGVDSNKFPDQAKLMLAEKAPKLKRYKDEGLETWIVAYNTVWTISSPLDVQRIMGTLLGLDHAHVDHVGICAGNPPDDAWIIEVR